MRSLLCVLSIVLLAAVVHAGGVLAPGAAFPTVGSRRSDRGQGRRREISPASRTCCGSSRRPARPVVRWRATRCATSSPSSRARGVTILGVSFDPPADNAVFVKEQGFPFRLLSDADRKLAVAVGAAADPSQAYAQRISYLVGSDGKVVKAYPQVTPKTHAQEVLTDLGSSPAAPKPAQP